MNFNTKPLDCRPERWNDMSKPKKQILSTQLQQADEAKTENLLTKAKQLDSLLNQVKTK